jgi:hypothetical protein
MATSSICGIYLDKKGTLDKNYTGGGRIQHLRKGFLEPDLSQLKVFINVATILGALFIIINNSDIFLDSEW